MALLRGRFGLYALISTIATYAVVRYAYTTREQFYPAVIYMVSSKTSIVVLCNMALVLIVTAAAALKALFLGELRTAEVERVNEALRFTIPEICVALTLFREELTMRVLGLFAMLLFSRFFHTVLDERMNFLEGNNDASSLGRFGHVRLIALMWTLMGQNALCLAVLGHVLHTSGHSVLMLFAFEYVLMALEVVRVMYRYLIYLISISRRAAGEWPNRGLYLMYGKLGVDLVRLGVYIMYFMLLFTFYGMPLTMIRDLIRAFLEVNKQLKNVIASRRLRAQINERFPCPTAADLAVGGLDNTCVVCLHDITPDPPSLSRSKKLPCNHVFHTSCLLMWWERQQNCPTCRADVNALMQRDAAAAAAAGRTGPAAAAGAAPAAGGAAAQPAPAPGATGTDAAAPQPPATTGGAAGIGRAFAEMLQEARSAERDARRKEKAELKERLTAKRREKEAGRRGSKGKYSGDEGVTAGAGVGQVASSAVPGSAASMRRRRRRDWLEDGDEGAPPAATAAAPVSTPYDGGMDSFGAEGDDESDPVTAALASQLAHLKALQSHLSTMQATGLGSPHGHQLNHPMTPSAGGRMFGGAHAGMGDGGALQAQMALAMLQAQQQQAQQSQLQALVMQQQQQQQAAAMAGYGGLAGAGFGSFFSPQQQAYPGAGYVGYHVPAAYGGAYGGMGAQPFYGMYGGGGGGPQTPYPSTPGSHTAGTTPGFGAPQPTAAGDAAAAAAAGSATTLSAPQPQPNSGGGMYAGYPGTPHAAMAPNGVPAGTPHYQHHPYYNAPGGVYAGPHGHSFAHPHYHLPPHGAPPFGSPVPHYPAGNAHPHFHPPSHGAPFASPMPHYLHHEYPPHQYPQQPYGVQLQAVPAAAVPPAAVPTPLAVPPTAAPAASPPVIASEAATGGGPEAAPSASPQPEASSGGAQPKPDVPSDRASS